MFKLLFIISIIKLSKQILIGINEDTKNLCFSKFIEYSDIIHLAFYVTGDDQNEKIDVQLHDPHGKQLYKMLNANQGQYKDEAKSAGKYKLCFIPKFRSSPHYISFEYYSAYERGHTLNMAKDGIYN
jgi:hypothetical protein